MKAAESCFAVRQGKFLVFFCLICFLLKKNKQIKRQAALNEEQQQQAAN